MSIDQPGLRPRMGREARRISSQHRQLDTLFELLQGALIRRAAEDARASFTRFCDALDAHFSLEDGFYFPAVHGMHPQLQAQLSALSEEHAGFRAELEALGPVLEGGAFEDAGRRLEALAERLAAHEEREEALVGRLQRGGA